MLEIRLDNISPDGDGHVAYIQIFDTTLNKIVQVNTIAYTTEEKFHKDVKDLLSDFKGKHEMKESIKTKVLAKLSAINLAEKEVK